MKDHVEVRKILNPSFFHTKDLCLNLCLLWTCWGICSEASSLWTPAEGESLSVHCWLLFRRKENSGVPCTDNQRLGPEITPILSQSS